MASARKHMSLAQRKSSNKTKKGEKYSCKKETVKKHENSTNRVRRLAFEN